MATTPTPAPKSRDDRRGAPDERGIALVLALIFTILLYILVAELRVAGAMVRATGENDALLARMGSEMQHELADAEEQLLKDLAGQAAGGQGGSPLGNALGNSGASNPGSASGQGGQGQGQGQGGESEQDPSTQCDSSRDGWFEPTGHPDNDITTYVWVEDENRKLNILSLWSPDEKFADLSRDRLVRLIDTLREDSDLDVSTSDAQRIVQDIIDWGKRQGTEMMPRPSLKSDDDKRREICAPLHLDELTMLPSISEDLFYDRVLDSKWYPGLESVLTLWTSLRVDPGDPAKLARQAAAAEARGEKPKSAPTEQPGGSNPQQPPNSSQPGGAEQPPPQPDGLGILINVNTASRQVLRALFPPDKIPDRVIDAIIKYRNEVDEDAAKADADKTGGTEVNDFGSGNMRLGSDQKRKIFVTLQDLEKVEEFAKLPDPQTKSDFEAALTTKSEVFSIHLASLYKRNEKTRIYLLRRARAIVMRIDDGADGKIVPLVPFEERTGLRVMPVDIQTDSPDLTALYNDMDQFAQEDRAWNPFLIDFYLRKDLREQFYQPR
jgi:hypothetical protein